MTPIIPQETKACTKCGVEYPRTLEFFRAKKRMKDNIDSWCRKCCREAARLRYEADPERHNAASKAYREANLDEIRAYDKVRNEARAGINRARVRQWAKNNPEKARANRRKWEKLHPEEVRAKDQRRRAKKRNLPHTLTVQEWENILADYGYQCAYCPKTWIDCKLTQDHVIPVDQGGGYTKENIVPACLICNDKKGARTPEQAGMPLRTV